MRNTALHIVLVILLLAGTTGVTVMRHYCGGSIRYAQLAVGDESGLCCGEDGEIQMPCCHNELSSLRLEDQFTVVSHPMPDAGRANHFVAGQAVVACELLVFQPRNTGEDRGEMHYHGKSVSIPILNQSFLI